MPILLKYVKKKLKKRKIFWREHFINTGSGSRGEPKLIICAPTHALDHLSLYSLIEFLAADSNHQKETKSSYYALKFIKKLARLFRALQEEFNLLIHGYEELRFGRMLIKITKGEEINFYIPSDMTPRGLATVMRSRIKRILARNQLYFILTTAITMIVIYILTPGSIFLPPTWPIAIPSLFFPFYFAYARVREDIKIWKASIDALAIFEKKNLFFSVIRNDLLKELRDRFLVVEDDPLQRRVAYSQAINFLKAVSEDESQYKEDRELARSLLPYYLRIRDISQDEGYLDRLWRLWHSTFRAWLSRFKWLRRIDKLFILLETRILGFSILAAAGFRLPISLYTASWALPVRIIVRLVALGLFFYYYLADFFSRAFNASWQWISQLI